VATYYLDTSALVKRYAREQGSGWITGLMARRAGHDLYTVRLTGPEAIAALTRKVRMGQVTAASAARSSRAFRRHWQRRLLIVEVAEAVAEQAMDLAERHGLRGYDAVHLAAALVVAEAQRQAGRPPLTFVSADTAQGQAAVFEGLLVEDPNTYP
jgi:predicted nucleic acid-binding protein